MHIYLAGWSLILSQVVKIADFGVARVQAQPGVMTAETGTYRWMAPEVGILVEFIHSWIFNILVNLSKLNVRNISP